MDTFDFDEFLRNTEPPKTKKENLHANHRQRVKKKFLKFGLDAFSEHEVLEMLLFYVLPHVDTNEIAHNLINKAGSFPAVFDLPIEEMKNVKGIKDQAASFLKLIPEISRFYAKECIKQTIKPKMTYDEIGEYITSCFIGRSNETLMGFYFDANMHLISENVIRTGSSSNVSVFVREIADEVKKVGATNIIIAHNHPEHRVAPSYEDIDSTRHLAKLLEQLQIKLVEHFVISAGRYIGVLKFVDDQKEKYNRE